MFVRPTCDTKARSLNKYATKRIAASHAPSLTFLSQQHEVNKPMLKASNFFFYLLPCNLKLQSNKTFWRTNFSAIQMVFSIDYQHILSVNSCLLDFHFLSTTPLTMIDTSLFSLVQPFVLSLFLPCISMYELKNILRFEFNSSAQINLSNMVKNINHNYFFH